MAVSLRVFAVLLLVATPAIPTVRALPSPPAIPLEQALILLETSAKPSDADKVRPRTFHPASSPHTETDSLSFRSVDHCVVRP